MMQNDFNYKSSLIIVASQDTEEGGHITQVEIEPRNYKDINDDYHQL